MKILGLSIADIFILIFGLITLKNYIYEKKKIIIEKNIKIIFIRDLLYMILGSFSYIITKSYFLDNGKAYLINIRHFLYCWICYFLLKYLEEKRIKNQIDYIKIFKILILGSCILSIFYRKEDVWIRFGNKIWLLSQEWGAYFLVYLLIYIILELWNRYTLSKLLWALILIIIISNDFYKTSILQILYFIIFVVLFIFKNKLKKYFFIMIAVIFSVIIATISIINLKETDGIKTRFLQVNEYITYIKKQDDEIYRILLGSGMGSPYEGKMGDFGESKAIDRQKFGKYKFAMHVQYFVNFTEVGVIGFVLVIFINIYIFINITIKNNHIKNRENIEYIFVIYIITYNLFSLLITLGSPIMAIFSGIVYARYDQLKKEIFLKNSEIKRRF